MSQPNGDPAPYPSPTKLYHREVYAAIDPTRPELSTKGKNVVVTGGGSGIGAEIVRGFAKSGASNLALIGRTKATLTNTKEALAKLYPSTTFHAYVADIVDARGISSALLQFSEDVQGEIDILVANAGYQHEVQPMLEIEAEEWWRGWEINIRGAFNLVRAAAPLLARNAVVENITSGVTQIPYMPGHSGYQGSKLGALKVFDAFAAECPNVRVISWHPGVLKTDMYEHTKDGGVDLPLDDMSLPASYAVWLVSPEAEFLNGKNVWAHWNVDELKEMAEEIRSTPKFTIGLIGTPHVGL